MEAATRAAIDPRLLAALVWGEPEFTPDAALPSDGTAMLQQTAQFTTVETLKEISEANQRLMGFQQVTMALTIVGKPITAVGLDGSYVSGEVEGLRFTADGPFLQPPAASRSR